MLLAGDSSMVEATPWVSNLHSISLVVSFSMGHEDFVVCVLVLMEKEVRQWR